ncbi:hypothetical protein, partial [Pseudomonas aeruginosa]|uniref:hypothetical protein n=1 Tax=Pseudomonas aeruginosa TaxID=287 RepID=UPI002576A3C9
MHILYKELEKLGKDNEALKIKISSFIETNEELIEKVFILEKKNKSLKPDFENSKTSNDLIKENEELKKKIEDLNQIIFKFTKGKDNFEKMLGNQKEDSNKGGLGYSGKSKITTFF